MGTKGGFKATPESLTFKDLADASKQLIVTVFETNVTEKLAFTSEDEKVASVASDGLVTPRGKGTTKVNFVPKENPLPDEKGSVEVTVEA